MLNFLKKADAKFTELVVDIKLKEVTEIELAALYKGLNKVDVSKDFVVLSSSQLAKPPKSRISQK